MPELEKVEQTPASSKIDVTPVNGNLILSIPKISKKTPGGLIKTDGQMEEERKKLPKYSEVVAVCKNSDFKVGQYVMIQGGAGYNKIEVDGDDYAIIEQFSVIAIAEGKVKQQAIEAQVKFKQEEVKSKLSKLN